MDTSPKKIGLESSQNLSALTNSELSSTKQSSSAETENRLALKSAIEHYKTMLEALQNADQLSTEQLLDVRIARDAIHGLELERPCKASESIAKEIKQLDKTFKQQIRRFKTEYRKQALKRNTQDSMPKWWWFPEPPPPQPFWNHLDSVWSGASLIFLTFSGGLIADLAVRVLSGGLDVWGSSTVIIQSMVTLLVGKGALTSSGQETVKQWLGKRGFPKRLWDEGSFLVSAGLFLALLGFQSFALPEFAKFYKCLGDADYSKQSGLPRCLPGGDRWIVSEDSTASDTKVTRLSRLSSAEVMYKRALSLNPDYADTHFALGRIYEDLQDLQRAQETYEKALKGGRVEAYHQLALLALKQEKPDYDKAVVWLSRGLEEVLYREEHRELRYRMVDTFTHIAVSDTKGKNDKVGSHYLDDAAYWLSRVQNLGIEEHPADQMPEEQPSNWSYVLTRNNGWMLWRQGELDRAIDSLIEAIHINPIQADAYCLRAQVFQAQLNELRLPKTARQAKQLEQKVVEDWQQCRTLCSPYSSEGKVLDPDEVIWQRKANKQLKKYNLSLKFNAKESRHYEA